MIKVSNLVKEFRNNEITLKAIDNVSFEVNKGEVFGIIGLSGAGKSTLVRCLNRLEEPNEGSIILNGKNILNLNNSELLKIRRDIGMIFQSFNLFNQSTVYENVAYPLEVAGYKKEEIKIRVEEMLDFVGLLDKKDSYPSQISGGQKQRVAIARALATKPKILLSDESTSALDPANTEQILKLLKESVKKFNMTIVLITHQMEVAKNICDRIAVMENGKIIESDTVENIFKNPKTERTKSFINSLPDEAEEISLDKNQFSGKLYRLNFGASTVNKPIISDLIKNTNCTVNVLSGNISTLSSGSTSGYLVVELIGQDKDIFKGINKIKKENVGVEEL